MRLYDRKIHTYRTCIVPRPSASYLAGLLAVSPLLSLTGPERRHSTSHSSSAVLTRQLEPSNIKPDELISARSEMVRDAKELADSQAYKLGIDASLPPMRDILEIFADLTGKAVSNGLEDVTQYLKNRKLKVATMCSGTESPLLALEMIASGEWYQIFYKYVD